jgi:uncharacterized membrane protein
MDSLYTLALFLHSWNRWLVLIAGIVVLTQAIKGFSKKSEYCSCQTKWMLIFISSLHLQLLVGLLLYFVLSPITGLALHDFGAAMKDSVQRFWAVEHAFVNIIAVGLAQTGSILVKRTNIPARKNKLTIIWISIALILILAMIPMGIMGVDRPWFRF